MKIGPLHCDRIPMRGVGWIIACEGIGGAVLIVSPRWYLQFRGLNDYFEPPEWIHWRVDEP